MFQVILTWQACPKLIDRFKEREENVKVVGMLYNSDSNIHLHL